MLSVELEIPSDKVQTTVGIVNHDKLNKVFKSCGVNSIDPDGRTQVQVDSVDLNIFQNFVGISLDVRNLMSTFGDKVRSTDPGSLNLGCSLANVFNLAKIFLLCSFKMLKLLNDRLLASNVIFILERQSIVFFFLRKLAIN